MCISNLALSSAQYENMGFAQKSVVIIFPIFIISYNSYYHLLSVRPNWSVIQTGNPLITSLLS